MTEKIALYPGSFDPMTNGHLDIVRRCALVFDRIEVAVAHNPSKEPLFTPEERAQIIRDSTTDIENLTVSHFDGLTVRYARKINARYLIRGLRAISDFESEIQMAMLNRELDPGIETFFVVPDARYSYISSSMVKQLYIAGGPIADLLPPPALKMVEERLERRIAPEQ